MAWVNSGYERSLKVTITKTGSDNSTTIINEDGRQAFGSYPSLTTDEFKQLTLDSFNLRLDAWKSYLLNKYASSDSGLYASIPFTNTRREMKEVAVMSVQGTQGSEIIAILRGVINNNNLYEAPQELVVTFKDGNLTTRTLTIHPGQRNSSSIIYTTQGEGSVQDITDLTLTPNLYNIVLDTIQEYQ